MKNTSTLRRAALLGVAAAAMLVVSACGGDMGGMEHGSKPTSTAPTTAAPTGAAFNDADTQFAQMMIPHHQQAVEMATLAETRATEPEIKALAVAIKGAQDPEIKTMTGWLLAWGQPTAAPGGGHNMPGMSSQMPGMLSGEEMAKLKAAKGVEFDRLFARGMIAHHNGAIAMAKDEQAKGKNSDAKALAAVIEKAQAAEVDKLQKILDRL
ncbi:DUF305 domain-containing protein [Longispora sp. NPDC051575]|uniref:DUF305 domain-containing protein n=1 Tax=Longispora sp. NPDC051575 TaxID=3154943 RepID=UPI00342EC109